VKIKGNQVDRFVAKPDPKVRAALLYGPNAGLARTRAETLARTVVDDIADPFRVSEIAAADLAGDPARLADEAASLSLTGGRRVVRVREASDRVASVFLAFFEAPIGDALVVAEAGDLGPRSALRQAFEKADAGAALPCYGDDSRSLETVIRDDLRRRGIAIDADALEFLAVRVGDDRLVALGEVEKLALYMGAETRVRYEDVVASTGDATAFVLDDVVYAMADGDLVGLDRALARAFEGGVGPVAVLRAAQTHVQRLHVTVARMAKGEPVAAALKRLRPPVFWKVEARFRRQADAWKASLLAASLARLTEAELACKTTGAPDAALCARALLEIAGAARRGRAGAG